MLFIRPVCDKVKYKNNEVENIPIENVHIRIIKIKIKKKIFSITARQVQFAA